MGALSQLPSWLKGILWRTPPEGLPVEAPAPPSQEEGNPLLEAIEPTQVDLAQTMTERPVPPEYSPIQYPAPPTYQEMPETAPRGLKAGLKRMALGMIPGFTEGFEREVGRRREDIATRNRQAMEVYKEEMDRATAEHRERGLEENRQATLQFKNWQEQAKQERELEKIEIARQRAEGYQAGIEGLNQKRTADAMYDAQNLQRMLDRDQMIDANTKQRLGQYLEMARGNLSARINEEMGRTQRVQMIQREINNRAMQYSAKYGYERVLTAQQKAAKSLSLYPGADQMTEEERLQALDVLSRAELEGKMPKITYKDRGLIPGGLPIVGWGSKNVPSFSLEGVEPFPGTTPIPRPQMPAPVSPPASSPMTGGRNPLLDIIQLPQGDHQYRIGEEKKFPNGNIGIWDGKGWVLKIRP